jgi:hypothetical protein
VDSSGTAYITGKTASLDFPTVNAFQPAFAGGDDDAFVAKFNPDGSALIYSTYLGGSGSEGNLSRIALNSSGDAYIVGKTDSRNFPTVNPIQSVNLSAGDNAFVTKLNAAGNGLVYSTYLGGNVLDFGFGIAVDASGSAYVAGQTWSGNFPTVNPFQGSRHGTDDAFIAKIVEPPPVVLTGVASRKIHGSAGSFDLDLPLTGTPGIECRSGGPNGDHTLVFTFLNTLSTVTGITATATTSSGTQTLTPTGNIGTDTHEYIVNLTGVPNASHLNVTLNGVTDSANHVGDVSGHMDVLLGDVNSTGRTDSGDVTAVRNKTVSIPDQQTFQFDVNISGRIDSGDVTATRNATVTVLPP